MAKHQERTRASVSSFSRNAVRGLQQAQRDFNTQLRDDGLHFLQSLAWELRGVIEAAPGYAKEILDNGLYPNDLSFKKLERNQNAGSLQELKKLNPDWPFREGYDPDNMVIVFLHGYIDNTGADRIAHKLAQRGYHIYVVRYPFLRSVKDNAVQLAEIVEHIGLNEPGKSIVPIGHSLGGFLWDELLLENSPLVERYNMPLYIPLGSPHFGTLAAYIGVGKSAEQMEPISDVVSQHLSRSLPSKLKVYPFVSRFDLLVLPIESALMKNGINYLLSETGHVAQIIRDEIVIAIDEILSTDHQVLLERAESRPFYPSSLMRLLARLPEKIQQKLGVVGPREYVHGGGDQAPEFWLRIVHHEIKRNTFPQLIRPRQ